MANITSTSRSAHHTLTANTVDVVTLDQAYPFIEVTNRDTAADLWFTIDSGPSGNQTSVTPTVGGDGCYYVGPGGVYKAADDALVAAGVNLTNPASVVRLISASAISYSVTGLTS